MNSGLLTVRCPEDLLQAINERVKESGKRKTDVVIQALRVGLGVDDARPSGLASTNNGSPHQSDYLSRQLEEIKNEIAKDVDQKYNALVQQSQDTVQQVVKQVVKQAEEEAFTRFAALVQQELTNVRHVVK